MQDFASAVLVAAVQQALAEHHLAPPPPPPTAALIPLTAKRRLLTDIATTHGLAPLLSVGTTLTRLPPHPAIDALRAATGPADLFTRWATLQRFLHSRHRVVVHDLTATGAVAEHTGPPGSPPHPAEDILILGILAALLTDTGTQDLTAAIDGGDTLISGTTRTAPPADTTTSRWRFTWSAHTTPPRPAPPHHPDTTGHCRTVLAADPARRWTVADLAAATTTSIRTLQRQLRPGGGFTALLGAVRAGQAATLLTGSTHPLGIVGFICGYADQPHFTREFRRRTAMTPAAYRAAFTPPAPTPEAPLP